MCFFHIQNKLLKNVVIPLTHHKNSGYTELKVLGVYLSPAAGGGKITSTVFNSRYNIVYFGVSAG